MNVSSNISFTDNTMAIILSMGLAWNLVYVFLSPLFAYVLFVGFQQWRKRRSRCPAHSDVFTFNMAAFEMLTVLGSGINIAAFIASRFDLYGAGNALCYMATLGQALLHCLVSAERYLAVVHPLAYLRLKKKGADMRNVSIAAVWLFSSITVIVLSYEGELFKTCSQLVVGSASAMIRSLRIGPSVRKELGKGASMLTIIATLA